MVFSYGSTILIAVPIGVVFVEPLLERGVQIAKPVVRSHDGVGG